MAENEIEIVRHIPFLALPFKVGLHSHGSHHLFVSNSSLRVVKFDFMLTVTRFMMPRNLHREHRQVRRYSLSRPRQNRTGEI